MPDTLVRVRPTVGIVSNDGAVTSRVASALAVAGLQVLTDDSEGAPDVLVVVEDAELPNTGTAARVVAIVSEGRVPLRRALALPADGIVPLAALEDVLVPTITAVHAGQVVVPPYAWAQSRRPLLSTREKQILAMVVLGFSNGEISQKLFIAETTVKSHLSSAFGKLGVASRGEAAERILDPQTGLGTGILAISDAQDQKDGVKR